MGEHPQVHALQWESPFQLNDTEHAEVVSRLGRTAGEPGYPAST
jgi:hypothetical protein